jgi:hypothetical protein
MSEEGMGKDIDQVRGDLVRHVDLRVDELRGEIGHRLDGNRDVLRTEFGHGPLAAFNRWVMARLHGG